MEYTSSFFCFQFLLLNRIQKKFKILHIEKFPCLFYEAKFYALKNILLIPLMLIFALQVKAQSQTKLVELEIFCDQLN